MDICLLICVLFLSIRRLFHLTWKVHWRLLEYFFWAYFFGCSYHSNSPYPSKIYGYNTGITKIKVGWKHLKLVHMENLYKSIFFLEFFLMMPSLEKQPDMTPLCFNFLQLNFHGFQILVGKYVWILHKTVVTAINISKVFLLNNTFLQFFLFH